MRTSSGNRSAAATTGSGNRVGRLCERSTISMSTPGSPRNPSFSSTTPWATRRPSGKSVKRAWTISPSRAPRVSPSSMRMTASIFGSYGRTTLRPSLVSKRPTTRSRARSSTRTTTPDVRPASLPRLRPPVARVFSSRASTVSPSIAPCIPTRGTKRSSPSLTRTKPNPSGRTVIRPAIRLENSIAEYFSPRTRAISPRRSRASRRERKAVSSMSRRRKAFIRSWNERTREPLSRRRSRMSESGGSTGRSLSCGVLPAGSGADGRQRRNRARIRRLPAHPAERARVDERQRRARSLRFRKPLPEARASRDRPRAAARTPPPCPAPPCGSPPPPGSGPGGGGAHRRARSARPLPMPRGPRNTFPH